MYSIEWWIRSKYISIFLGKWALNYLCFKTSIKNLLSVYANIKAQTLFVDFFTQYFNHRRLYITKKLHWNIGRLFQEILFQFLFQLNFYYVRLGSFLFMRILQNRQQKRVSKLIAKATYKKKTELYALWGDKKKTLEH